MDPKLKYISQYHEMGARNVEQVGGKAWNLSLIKNNGYHVPRGFCLETSAYLDFIKSYAIDKYISVEINKKSLQNLRWEELWDSALRIRNTMLSKLIPDSIIHEIEQAIAMMQLQYPLVVRSSSPDEDNPTTSFAGLFDSIGNCCSIFEVRTAIKKVWASLWSDEALMYRKELRLNPTQSKMAVLIQEQVQSDVSGIAFSANPANHNSNQYIIEAQKGSCDAIVSGKISPIKAVLSKEKKTVDDSTLSQLLSDHEIEKVINTLEQLDSLMKRPIDIEWTFQENELFVLQVRPITSFEEHNPLRPWYLSLKPKQEELEALCTEVEHHLIPALLKVSTDYKAKDLKVLNDDQLADETEERVKTVRYWRDVYKKKFIPFAHGIRQFGMYYNDWVKPDDPHEFIALLNQSNRIASKRYQLMMKLKKIIQSDRELMVILKSYKGEQPILDELINKLSITHPFLKAYNELKDKYLEITYNNSSFSETDFISLLIKYAKHDIRLKTKNIPSEIEKSFFNKIPEHEQSNAKHILHVGRVSWRLRDDDNILMGKLEFQLLGAIKEVIRRLMEQGLLCKGVSAHEELAKPLINSLRHKIQCDLRPLADKKIHIPVRNKLSQPRQLQGQPASPGFATGKACIIKNTKDFSSFNPGDVLVCDSVCSTMTHIVPLACAIVERRGGMLIHSTIIAREMGLPCVNGVKNIVDLIKNGDILGVDGSLGIVTFQNIT